MGTDKGQMGVWMDFTPNYCGMGFMKNINSPILEEMGLTESTYSHYFAFCVLLKPLSIIIWSLRANVQQSLNARDCLKSRLDLHWGNELLDLSKNIRAALTIMFIFGKCFANSSREKGLLF